MNIIRYTFIVLFILSVVHTILYYYNLDIFQYMFKNNDNKFSHKENKDNKINLEENIKELQHSLQELNTLS